MKKVGEFGYNPKNPEQIRAELLEEFKKIEGYEERPADLNNNLLNESVIICAYLENSAQFLFNSYAPSYANETIFNQFAAEQGLYRKGAYPSYAEFRIKGDVGTIIPAKTKITTANKDIAYFLLSEQIIGSSGEIIVSGYSDDDGSYLESGELCKLVNDIRGIKEISNINTPSPACEIEAFHKFKQRVQAKWRAPRAATWDILFSRLKSIDGVIEKCVNFRVYEKFKDLGNGNKKFYNCAELIILGGDNVEIAQALYESTGFSSFIFESEPSNNEKERKIQTNLKLGNSIIKYEFTRPKKSKIGIEVKLVLIGLTADSDSLQQLTQATFENYFKHLSVGSQINKLQLQSLFFDGFQRSGSKWIDVASIDFICKKNDKPAVFDEKDFLDIAFDEYLELEYYKVSLNA